MKTDSDITITRGNDESVVIPVEDEDTGGWLEDLSGMSITYDISTKIDGTNQLTKTDADAEVTTPEASTIDSEALTDTGVPDSADVVLVELTETETKALTDRWYAHECKLEGSAGVEKTVMQGDVRVQDSSTVP